MNFEFIAPNYDVVFNDYLRQLSGLARDNFILANTKGFLRIPIQLRKVRRLYSDYCENKKFPKIEIAMHRNFSELFFDAPFLPPEISKSCLSEINLILKEKNPFKKSRLDMINGNLIQIHKIDFEVAKSIANLIIMDRMNQLGEGKTLWERILIQCL